MSRPPAVPVASRRVPARRRASLALLALAPSLLLGACGGGRSRHDTGSVVRVAAAMYPLAWMAEQIGGTRVAVTDLTPPGAEPHDLEVGPDQLDVLDDADVVLVLGRGFQPSVERAAARQGSATTAVLDALPASVRNVAGGDPHVWLDPMAFGAVADVVTAALTRADPDGAPTYRAGHDAVHAVLTELDGALADGLRDCERRTIVTSHAAFGRLAARHGLVQQSVSGLSPDAEPDPRRLGELADLVRREGITTVFTEELVSPAVAEALANEAGVRTAVLDPIESRSDAARRAGRAYPDLLRRDLAALRRALDCR